MPPRERQHEGLGERQHEGLGERQHEGLGERQTARQEVFGLGDSFAVGLGAVAGACVGRWTGQPRMPPRERQHEGLGDSFAVGLGAVAGACVGRWTGQPRMPPRERQHEGLGAGERLDWEPLRKHVLAGGPASHACRRGSGSTRG